MISCITTGRLGIVPSFSILARYRDSMFTFSAKSFRVRCFAFRAALRLRRKFQNRGNLRFLPYCITHLHSIFHSLPMECCKIHFDYSLYFIFVCPVVKCGKGRLMLLNVTFCGHSDVSQRGNVRQDQGGLRYLPEYILHACKADLTQTK